MMGGRRRCSHASQVLALLLLWATANAFAPAIVQHQPAGCVIGVRSKTTALDLFRRRRQEDQSIGEHGSRHASGGKWRWLPARLIPKRSSVKKVSFAVGLFFATFNAGKNGVISFHPPPAHAGNPSAKLHTRELKSATTLAMEAAEKKTREDMAKEFRRHEYEAGRILTTKGPTAERNYRKQYKAEKERQAREQLLRRKKMKLDFLYKGMNPYCDYDAVRLLVMDKYPWVDLNTIEGTEQWVVRKMTTPEELELRFKMARFLARCELKEALDAGQAGDLMKWARDSTFWHKSLLGTRVRDLQERFDEYYAKYPELYENEDALMPAENKAEENKKAAQISKEKEAKAKALEAEAKAKAKEEARIAKEKAKAAKAKAKEEAKTAKEAAKKEKESQKAAAAAAAGAVMKAAETGTGGVESAAEAAVDTTQDLASLSTESKASSDVAEDGEDPWAEPEPKELEDLSSKTESTSPKTIDKLPLSIVPAATVLVAGGGGGAYAFTKYRQKAAADEEERQRQFKLIMGMDDETSSEDEDDEVVTMISSLTDDDDDEEEVEGSTEVEEKPIVNKETPPEISETTEPKEVSAPAVPEKPKRRRGIKGMFSRKNENTRETDLKKLIAPDAEAPELALTLAKLCTYGAPGRFPAITSLSGGMPLSGQFDLEAAKQLLIESREKAGITIEASAEIFASVVNCMIIDIIDLASSTLKEDEKVTVDAINVVMAFMDHAASLFDSVAADAKIKPVTYGGTLGRNKLEQMYTIYASPSMTTLEPVDPVYIDQLRVLFDISEKKAENLMQKAMQKQLMKMMKEGMKGGEGSEDFAEMMKGMGGMEGLMGGDGEMPEMSPEELKTTLKMMKDMIDSGQVPPEEIKTIREQFKAMYGEGIDELVRAAEDESGGDIPEDEKEILEMMKSILEEK